MVSKTITELTRRDGVFEPQRCEHVLQRFWKVSHRQGGARAARRSIHGTANGKALPVETPRHRHVHGEAAIIIRSSMRAAASARRGPVTTDHFFSATSAVSAYVWVTPKRRWATPS